MLSDRCLRVVSPSVPPERLATCNNGAKEIQFFQAGATPYGCYIGMEDGFRDGRQAWADGSTVEYMNWAAGLVTSNPHHNLIARMFLRDCL